MAVPRPIESARLRSWYVNYQLLRLFGAVLWLRVTGRLSRRQYGRRVRLSLERLGTLWIRAGQLLALRSDVFSGEFCEELSALRDIGPRFSFDIVEMIVEQELGAPLERHFDKFERDAFSATTISQVHMAHLRQENLWVAVNVQQPHAERLFHQDMRQIRRFVRLLQAFSLFRNMRWKDLCQELETLMCHELDYRFEASSLRRLRKNLRQHGVHVPKVFSKYTSRRVLVTEFIRAALMSDYIQLERTNPQRLKSWLTANNISRRRLSRRLFASVFRQIFEDNHFHTDMHPGNVILLRDSQFSVVDSRGVGMLESEALSKHRMFFESLADQNYALAADIYLFLAAELPVVDITEVRSRLIREFRAWETRTHVPVIPFREKSITCLLQELSAITFHYRFASQWSLSKLARTWANLDASLEHLWPEINYLEQMRKYFRQAKQRDDRNFYRSNLDIVRNLSDVAELPKRMSQNELFRQTVVRRQAQVFQGSTNRISYVVSAMLGWVTIALLLTGAFVTTVLLSQHHDVPIQPFVGRQLSQLVDMVPEANYWGLITILVLLLYLFRVSRRLARSLRQTNVRVPAARAAV